MKRSFFSDRSAMTLVELMVAVLMMTFIFAACITILITSMNLFKTELSEGVATDDLTIALEWIKKDAMRSDFADITTANEVTLDTEDFDVSPPVDSQIRYYVKGGTTELYRQVVGSGIDGKLITNLIDSANPPIFSQPAESNYLLAEIWTKDPGENVTIHQDIGAMLRCRSTAL